MRLVLTMAGIALAGCSAGQNSNGRQNASPARDSAAETAQPGVRSGGDGPARGDQPEKLDITLPQLAYRYSLGFILPNDKLGEALNAHRALCEQMGPARCQLLALEHGDVQDRTSEALLKLRVATNEARRFADLLAKTATDAGGRPSGTEVEAEDVSKQIVDARARTAQRELLVQRLTEVLRTRSGKVSELIEAERSVAQAQEELDQARGWLNALQGRVAMSDFEIRYTATAPAATSGSVANQLGEASQGSLANFLLGLRALLTLAIYLAPWALLAAPAVLFFRSFRRRARSAASARPGDA